MTFSTAQPGADPRESLSSRREHIVTAWRMTLASTAYVPLGADEQRKALLALIDRLVDVLLAETFEMAQAQAIGVDLVKLGYARAAALGRTLDLLGRELLAQVDPIDAQRLQARLNSVLAGLAEGFTSQISQRILGEQETIREALLTQRDLAEEALRESEARFRAIFEAAPFGIAVSDMQGRILTANPALQAILGWTEDEMRGRVILAELAHPEDGEAGFANFVALAEGRSERYEVEQRFFARDGRVVWAQLAMAVVRAADGNPQFAIAMGRDIPGRNQAEAERLQLLREQAARAEAEAARSEEQ